MNIRNMFEKMFSQQDTKETGQPDVMKGIAEGILQQVTFSKEMVDTLERQAKLMGNQGKAVAELAARLDKVLENQNVLVTLFTQYADKVLELTKKKKQ